MSGFTFFYITAALTGLLILVTCGVWLRYDLRVLPVWAFHREIDFDKLAPVGQPVTVGARETVRVALQLRSTADQEPLTPAKASR